MLNFDLWIIMILLIISVITILNDNDNQYVPIETLDTNVIDNISNDIFVL